MGWIATYRRLVTTLFVAALVAACTSGGGQTPGSQSASPALAASGAGHVIHVNLFVPLASAATLGSACDAAALSATGPVAATIPGSRLQFFALPLPAAPPAPGSANETLATITPIGEQPVPQTGTVVKPIYDEGSSFPTACLFSFDVATTAEVDYYAFDVGSVYFPIPIIPRADLEAAGWIASIGVNPQ
jgi:hypothetical protein